MSTSSYHHGDLRSALLQAAGALLEEEGLPALSLREAARRAGVSHNAPYRHFPDRDSLLAALAADGFRLLNEGLGKRADRNLGIAYLEFALAHRHRFRLMFGGQISFAKYPELQAQADASYAGVERAFAELGTDAPIAAAAAWSMVHGLASLVLDGHFERGVRESGGAAAFAKKVLGSMRGARAQRSA